jgi:hypothetical protein
MMDVEETKAARRSSLLTDLQLFMLTWAAGFVFTLVFFS